MMYVYIGTDKNMWNYSFQQWNSGSRVTTCGLFLTDV